MRGKYEGKAEVNCKKCSAPLEVTITGGQTSVTVLTKISKA